MGGHDEEKERILAANAAARAAAQASSGSGTVGHGSLQMTAAIRPNGGIRPNNGNNGNNGNNRNNNQRASIPPINQATGTASGSHEPNLSYADPIDEALHTSYQWTKPGFSIDHVCCFLFWFCF